jgi:Acyl-coenzyme A:6-aminopenicillanic acid acyl-transferase
MTALLQEQRLGDLRWLVLRGPAAEAFARLGACMGAEIREILAASPTVGQLRRHVAGPLGSSLLTAVRQASEERFGEVWAELAALADGAEVPLDDLALLNFRGDVGIDAPASAGNSSATAVDAAGCSDLAWRRQRSFIAHNEDESAFFDGRCVMLTLALDGLQPVTAFWKPGFLPSGTFTATGTGLAWSIDHLPVGSPGPGAGRHVVARGLQRAAATVGQAIGYLRDNPSAGGFAYTIGDRAGRVVIVEAAAGQHAWREVGADGPAEWHTNHGRYVAGAAAGSRGTSELRGQVLAAIDVPDREPDAGWFVDVLAGATPPAGVRAEPVPGDADSAVTQCTFVVNLSDGDAVVACRGAKAVSIPLDDLAHGRQRNQHLAAVPHPRQEAGNGRR